MSRSVIALLLAALASVSAAQDSSPRLVMVTVGPTSYQVGEATAKTLSAVIADLRAVANLDGVGIQAEAGVPHQRIDALVAAIQASGLKVRIGIVANDVH